MGCVFKGACLRTSARLPSFLVKIECLLYLRTSSSFLTSSTSLLDLLTHLIIGIQRPRLALAPFAVTHLLRVLATCDSKSTNIRPTMPITTLPLAHLLASTDHADFSGRRALSDVSSTIAKSKRVVVVSGAGISCSSGIPVCHL
jgi:hypothetical protein